MNTKSAPAAQSAILLTVLDYFDRAADWADGVDVDHDIMAPIIAAIRKRFSHLSLIQIELMLADARREIGPKIDVLANVEDLRRQFAGIVQDELLDD